MNILMLLDREFPPDIRVQNEALSLMKMGHKIHLLCYDFGRSNNVEVYRGITVHRFRIHKQVANKSLGLIHLLPFYREIWKFRVFEVLNKFPIDAVHIHDLPLCFLTRKLKETRVKVVADMHENYPYHVADQPYMNSPIGRVLLSKNKWFDKEKEWLQEADEIVCVANEMKERLSKVLGPSKKISIVPNTYNFDSFGAEQIQVPSLKDRFDGKLVVSYIGGFDPLRGINYLIEAIGKVKEKIPDIRLLLVGDGAIGNDLRQQTHNLGLSNIVSFEGWQPSSHIKAYIEASSVCVIPHIRSEQTDNSSPNKLFQYMYCRKPVISSNCRSLVKIIKEENCGVIFKDKDASDLAAKIIFLLTNPLQCEVLGTNGHKAVLEKYNWDTTVLPLLNIYEETPKEGTV